jgi:hypothetical protein
VPLAKVELGLGEGGAHRPVQPEVVVADHARWRPLEGAQERLPVGVRGVGKGLHAPELGASALEARRAEDPECDPQASGGRVTHREGQIVEQKRAGRRPGGGPVRLEDDRGKELDPVSDELAVARRARLARLRVGAQPPRPLARQKRRLALAHSGSDRDQRLGDRPRHELVVPRGVGPLVQTHRPLAGLAGVVPGLLARQQLREAMRPIPFAGRQR